MKHSQEEESRFTNLLEPTHMSWVEAAGGMGDAILVKLTEDDIRHKDNLIVFTQEERILLGHLARLAFEMLEKAVAGYVIVQQNNLIPHHNPKALSITGDHFKVTQDLIQRLQEIPVEERKGYVVQKKDSQQVTNTAEECVDMMLAYSLAMFTLAQLHQLRIVNYDSLTSGKSSNLKDPEEVSYYDPTATPSFWNFPILEVAEGYFTLKKMKSDMQGIAFGEHGGTLPYRMLTLWHFLTALHSLNQPLVKKSQEITTNRVAQEEKIVVPRIVTDLGKLNRLL